MAFICLSLTDKTTRENAHNVKTNENTNDAKLIIEPVIVLPSCVFFFFSFCTYDWHFSLLLIKTQLYRAGQQFTSFQNKRSLFPHYIRHGKWEFFAFNAVAVTKYKWYLKPQRIKILQPFLHHILCISVGCGPLTEAKLFINNVGKYEKRSKTFWENQTHVQLLHKLQIFNYFS